MAWTLSREQFLAAVREKLAEYQGTAVTVRQLYYRLVANGTFPNAQRSYKNLVGALSTWRRAKQIPYDAFEDRTRKVSEFDTGWRENDPDGWLAVCLGAGVKEAANYDLAKWALQPKRVVVAVEKQALEGPFAQVCEREGVDLAVCRGYASLSYLKEIAEALDDSNDRENVILYFGDFDPSGINIPETIERDLGDLFGASFELERIALVKKQINDMDLRPDPVKLTDSRAGKFRRENGELVYELDSIEPRTLQQIIADAILEHWDSDAAQEREEMIAKGRRRIRRTLSKSKIPKLIRDLKPEDDDEDKEA